MGARPRGLRIDVERKIAGRVEGELVEAKSVLAQQVLRLIEAQLARGGRGWKVLERGAGHRLEGAEVGVVQQTPPLEPGHDVEDLAVTLAGGADDELRGGAGRPQGARVAATQRELPCGALELRQQISREVLLPRQSTDVRVGRRLEVDRDARGEPRRLVDLRGLGAG